jgi:hypothetical protein
MPRPKPKKSDDCPGCIPGGTFHKVSPGCVATLLAENRLIREELLRLTGKRWPRYDFAAATTQHDYDPGAIAHQLGVKQSRNATCALDGSRSYTQERDGWKCCTCGMMGPTLDAILLKHTCQAQDDNKGEK